MTIQQNTKSIGENEERGSYEKPSYCTHKGLARLTTVHQGKIWFAPLNMCFNVLEMS